MILMFYRSRCLCIRNKKRGVLWMEYFLEMECGVRGTRPVVVSLWNQLDNRTRAS